MNIKMLAKGFTGDYVNGGIAEAIGAGGMDKLWYALPPDGRMLGPEQSMPGSCGEVDRYIFSVGLVTRKDRLLGVLYGAGASERCWRTRIFAHWLQKRVLLTARHEYNQGTGWRWKRAPCSQRQGFKLPHGRAFEGAISLFAEDGYTLIGT